ncbi:HeH/LEM domain-containing protein [Helcococcus kunzii]|uniref:HeH/LEM domain-containing protein n=1 Tax=Helcococcus kunzii TaxID=40091 RepID=UPI0024AE0FE8|nr:HeH/LEM domain-containing protein [Helcococcus kunzii]
MYIQLNQDVIFKDYKEDGKQGQVVEVTEELAKRIVASGCGKEIRLIKLTPKENKELTINEIKEILDKNGIEYDSKAKKEELIKLLPQE